MESIGFVLLYFLKGSLPWQGTRARDKKEKYEKIKEIKVNTPFEILCKNCPEEFLQYLKYCHALTFEEKPDYDFVRKIFRNLMSKNQYEADNIFDWILLKNVILILRVTQQKSSHFLMIISLNHQIKILIIKKRKFKILKAKKT